MKTVQLKVPRRVTAFVAFNVDPDDHNHFWRMRWHSGHYARGKRAERVMCVVALPMFLGLGLTAKSWDAVVIPAVVWWLLSFSVFHYHQSHTRQCNRIYDLDPSKWQAINDSLKPVSASCRPGDPEATIQFTLPDD